MKELPDTQTLLELLQAAKEAEEKAKQLYEMGVEFRQEWEEKLKGRN
ncbi:hypothetical protein [Gloeothece verrucosa]|uniref:Uncharacterized protein n=1 Tax=Gloeothece verrucosa (strain PCC 7822) TaxID=497965 RepID=E0UBF0_GLOV7|nr:hypothetical protein [Gloeothece verrucosa]ADN12782.1 hypothetical protein Cyan7822_0755 [Gloeothece verrucosa PCC 7822]